MKEGRGQGRRSFEQFELLKSFVPLIGEKKFVPLPAISFDKLM